jgi:hypothetical protein
MKNSFYGDKEWAKELERKAREWVDLEAELNGTTPLYPPKPITPYVEIPVPVKAKVEIPEAPVSVKTALPPVKSRMKTLVLIALIFALSGIGAGQWGAVVGKSLEAFEHHRPGWPFTLLLRK